VESIPYRKAIFPYMNISTITFEKSSNSSKSDSVLDDILNFEEDQDEDGAEEEEVDIVDRDEVLEINRKQEEHLKDSELDHQNSTQLCSGNITSHLSLIPNDDNHHSKIREDRISPHDSTPDNSLRLNNEFEEGEVSDCKKNDSFIPRKKAKTTSKSNEEQESSPIVNDKRREYHSSNCRNSADSDSSIMNSRPSTSLDARSQHEPLLDRSFPRFSASSSLTTKTSEKPYFSSPQASSSLNYAEPSFSSTFSGSLPSRVSFRSFPFVPRNSTFSTPTQCVITNSSSVSNFAKNYPLYLKHNGSQPSRFPPTPNCPFSIPPSPSSLILPLPHRSYFAPSMLSSTPLVSPLSSQRVIPPIIPHGFPRMSPFFSYPSYQHPSPSVGEWKPQQYNNFITPPPLRYCSSQQKPLSQDKSMGFIPFESDSKNKFNPNEKTIERKKSSELLVSNLSTNTTEKVLRNQFSQFGPIEFLEMLPERRASVFIQGIEFSSSCKTKAQ